MKVITTPLENHQVNILLEFDADEVEKAQRTAAQKINKDSKFPGFRPGKAPYEVIKKNFGDEAIRKEAYYLLADEYFPKALEETGYNIYGAGNLTDLNDTDPFNPKLTFIATLDAEVILGDYNAINIPYEPPAVTDEIIQKQLFEMQLNEAIIEPVDRPCKEGDHLTIHLDAKKLTADSDAAESILKETNTPIIILSADENTTNEYPYPGFSKQLIGMSVNEEKSFNFTYPADSPYESLRNVEAIFNVSIDKIAERILPTLDDEFAASVSDFDSLDKLEDNISNKLQEDLVNTYEEQYKEMLLNHLFEICTVYIPKEMLDKEVDNDFNSVKRHVESDGLNMDIFLTIRKMNEETYKSSLAAGSELHLKTELILLEIGEKEQIKVDMQEIVEKSKIYMQEYLENLPKKELKKIDRKRMLETIIGNKEEKKLISSVWERLKEISKGTVN